MHSGSDTEHDKEKEKDNSGGSGNDGDDDDEEDKGPSLLSVDQSAITGESLAVDKYVGDTVSSNLTQKDYQINKITHSLRFTLQPVLNAESVSYWLLRPPKKVSSARLPLS